MTGVQTCALPISGGVAAGARLNAAINQSLQMPDVVATAAKLNADITPVSPEAFGTFLAKEYDKWSQVVRSAGIKIE